MISADQFKSFKVQYTVFTPGLSFRATKVMLELANAFGDYFDAEPFIMPPIADFPPELPQLILKSKDGVLQLLAHSQRLDFHASYKMDADDDIERNNKLFLDVCSRYSDITKATISRLAYVVHRAKEQPNPATELSRHFCQERWTKTAIKRSDNFELHSHKKYKPEAFRTDLNSWMRCKSGVLNKGPKDGKTALDAILIEQDLNTTIESADSIEFQQSDIADFFKFSFIESDSILGLYFPGEDKS